MNSHFLVCSPEGARPPSPFSYRDDPWMSRQAENVVVMQSIQALRVPRNHLQRRSFHELIRKNTIPTVSVAPLCDPHLLPILLSLPLSVQGCETKLK